MPRNVFCAFWKYSYLFQVGCFACKYPLFTPKEKKHKTFTYIIDLNNAEEFKEMANGNIYCV